MTSTASVPPPALCPSDWSSAAREACGRFQYLTSQPPASVTSWKYAEGVSFPLGHNSEMEFRKRISVVTRPNRISASGVMRCCIPKKKKKSMLCCLLASTLTCPTCCIATFVWLHPLFNSKDGAKPSRCGWLFSCTEQNQMVTHLYIQSSIVLQLPHLSG